MLFCNRNSDTLSWRVIMTSKDNNKQRASLSNDHVASASLSTMSQCFFELCSVFSHVRRDCSDFLLFIESTLNITKRRTALKFCRPRCSIANIEEVFSNHSSPTYLPLLVTHIVELLNDRYPCSSHKCSSDLETCQGAFSKILFQTFWPNVFSHGTARSYNLCSRFRVCKQFFADTELLLMPPECLHCR